MANLLTSMMDKICIELGDAFLVTEMTDGEITGDPGPGCVPSIGNRDIRVGRSGLLLTSRLGQGSMHFVRYELWDARPEPPEAWDEIWSGEIQNESGTIAIAEWISWDEPGYFPAFNLGETGSSWSVRVLTKVMSNTEEPDFPDDIYKVQLYRLQLWRKPELA